MRSGKLRESKPGRNAQFGQQRRDVALDGSHGDDQPLGYLRVGQTLGQQLKNLSFAVGYPGGFELGRQLPAARSTGFLGRIRAAHYRFQC